MRIEQAPNIEPIVGKIVPPIGQLKIGIHADLLAEVRGGARRETDGDLILGQLLLNLLTRSLDGRIVVGIFQFEFDRLGSARG